MRTFIRLTIALMFGALLANITPGVASADTQIRARLDWVAYGLHAPFFIGIEKGWFKAKGLDVSVKDGNGSSKTITLVGAGEYDIGHANLSAMVLAVNKGLPVISVGHIVRKSDMAVIVASDSNIKTPKDLEGKKVAVTPGGFADPFFDFLLKAGGTSRSEMEVIGIKGRAKTAMYVSGQADALVSTAPYYLPVLADKRPSQAILFADYGIPLPAVGLVANTEFVKNNRQAVVDFLQVYFRALGWIYEGNEAEAVAIFQKHRPASKLSVKAISAIIASYHPYLSPKSTAGKPLGWHSDADWAKAISLISQTGLIKAGSDPKNFYTNTFVLGGK